MKTAFSTKDTPQTLIPQTKRSRLSGGSRIGGLVTIAVLALLVVFILYPRSETVDSYRSRLIASFNQNLESPTNAVRKKVEDAHLTVTAKSAKVTSCTVRTVDGSDRVGRKESNVADIDIVITVSWDGVIQKDGYTEVEIIYDGQNKKVKKYAIVRSNAAFNVEAIDWFSVGVYIGELIASL
jgi:hypothetical protein